LKQRNRKGGGPAGLETSTQSGGLKRVFGDLIVNKGSVYRGAGGGKSRFWPEERKRKGGFLRNVLWEEKRKKGASETIGRGGEGAHPGN